MQSQVSGVPIIDVPEVNYWNPLKNGRWYSHPLVIVETPTAPEEFQLIRTPMLPIGQSHSKDSV